MNRTAYLLLSVLVMALTTYLLRVVPLVLLRKKIKNRFLQSFLYYVPYAVLAAMTIPAVFRSTSSVLSAAIGTAAALITAYFGMSLMPVALISCCAVFLTEWIMTLL